MNRVLRNVLVAGALSLVGGVGAMAQTAFPDKPIRLIVPFSPGGTTDILARHFGQRLSESLGQPVLIENKTGAGTMIGAEYVAKSPADGYTLFVGTPSLWMNPVLYRKATYTLDEFVPVSTIARAPFVLSVSPKTAAGSLPELVSAGKASPGKLSYGILGLGGPSHLVGKLFEQTVGISAVDIPYRGSAPVMTDLVGGRINFYFDGIGTSLPMQRSGKIKIFAVTSVERSPAAPDIPTFKELGYPALEADTIWGIFAPAATPAAVVEKLSVAFQRIAQSEDLRATLMANGTASKGSTSEEFSALIKKDLDVWVRIVKSMNLQLD
jgi:tripartite-type tricarboxylate transporter receptor subunit TctC